MVCARCSNGGDVVLVFAEAAMWLRIWFVNGSSSVVVLGAR